MTTTEPSTAPECEAPDNDAFSISPEIDVAISTALCAWYDFGYMKGRDAGRVIAKQAQYDLRHAILAALEPDRALRERCERLRLAVDAIDEAWDSVFDISDPAIERERIASLQAVDDAMEAILPGDLADDLSASSSAHEGRD